MSLTRRCRQVQHLLAGVITTLITGDIVDEGTYGPDVAPDWDDTDNTDTLPLHNGAGPDFYTWRDDSGPYNPGALDRIIYTDSAVSVGNSFVLNTTTMSPEDLAAAGLEAHDVVLDPSVWNYDHLPLVADFLVPGGCEGDQDCDDGLFCNGVETCVDGSCVAGTDPCPGQWCDEDNDQCVDAPAFADDFENGNILGWDLYAPGSTASSGDWEIGNPNGTTSGSDQAQPENAYNGSGCAFTAQNSSLGSDDVDGGVVYLVSPTIDLSGATLAELQFVRWFYNRDLGEDAEDYFVADVSEDDGATWVNLETLDSNQNANSWTPRSFALESFINLTSTVRLRFGASDGPSSGNIIEAAIDDVQVWTAGGQEEYTLTVNVVGNGSVSKDPDQATYTYGQVVELTAIANPGWSFDHWEGDLTGSTNPDSITMDSDKTVTAYFTQDQYTLTVNVVGNGSVVRNPDQATYTYGQVVNLTAIANPGWSFDHWEGDLIGSTNPDSITMDADKTVTAHFTQDHYTLTVNITGQGSVDLDPPGGTYLSGTSVELTANAAWGWYFDHWEGDLTGSTNPETLVMDGDKTVTAVFEADCFGDIDGDGDIDLSDLAQLLANYGVTSGATYADGDLDGDGDVDLSDLSALLAVYGATCD